jgi:hypothetical protein
MEERFEDISPELDELDRAGHVKIQSYHDFYQAMLYYPERTDKLQPAGMLATNKNYTY